MIKPNEDLAKIVGKEPLSWRELLSKVALYIRENNLKLPKVK